MQHSRRHSESYPNERPKVKAGDVCVGCIVWLPAKNELNGDISCTCEGCTVHEELEEAGYNHPVVIVKIQQRKGSPTIGDLICDVVCITTFSDTTLRKYEAQRLRRPHLEKSIPIHHLESEELQDSHLKQLQLEKGKLHKQSYVRLKHIFRVDVDKLHTYKWRNFPAYRLRLAEESYEDLIHELGLTKPAYVETDIVVRTSKTRLHLLAIAQTPRAPTPRSPLPSIPTTTVSGGQVISTSQGGSYNLHTPQHHYSSLHVAGTFASQDHDHHTIPVVPGSYQHYLDHQERISVRSNQTHPQTLSHYGFVSTSQAPDWGQGNNNVLGRPQYGRETYPTPEEGESTSSLGIIFGIMAALTIGWIWWKW